MARYCIVGLFDNFRHRGHHGGTVRTENNQARGTGLDMVPLSQNLADRGAGLNLRLHRLLQLLGWPKCDLPLAPDLDDFACL